MTRYRQNPAIAAKRVDDDLFLVNPENDDIYFLNAIGAGVWNLLALPSTADELAATLAAAFPDMARDRLEADVARLVSDMAGRALILTGG